MKKQLLAALTAFTLLLTGCASLLEREYVHVTPHSTTPTAEGDPSILRADSYQELVNALIYFISQGMESGTVRLYSDLDDVKSDLDAACLEVVQEDPLGAYAVDYIKYGVNSVVSYCEAQVQITYRRTREQVASIVQATGTTAIRSELETALSTFSDQRVLRISYFDGDEDSIRALCREAYYANPATALDLPDADISIYPDAGRQRIVEIMLTYHLDTQELERRREMLVTDCRQLAQLLQSGSGDQLILDAARTVLNAGGYLPKGGSTAYHALLEGGADSEGLALAMALLCQELGVDCRVVEGALNGRPHFWNVVLSQSGWRHLDLTRSIDEEESFLTDAQTGDSGCVWDTQSIPPCG